ncbi:MAG: hypothetical protein AAGE52_02405 [Myxococcota bacterium]
MRRIFVSLLIVGCGASAEPTTQTAQAPVGEPEAVAETYEPPVTAGAISRADLAAVLDAGLGRFLQGVGTEPHLEDGHFVGFRLTRLYPEDPRFSSLDLQPGDTVTQINGQSIERPEYAMQIWNSLRVASQLLVEYRHGDESRELRFEIVD